MVGRAGFEPATNWLKANSPTELTAQNRKARMLTLQGENSSPFGSSSITEI